MIESFVWQLFVLAIASMLHPLVFAAGLLLLVVYEFQWLAMSEIMIPVMTSLVMPSVTILNASAYTILSMEQGGWIVMAIVMLLLVLPLCCYLYFAGSFACAGAHSRRLQMLTNAMLLVYGIVLLLAAIKIMSFAIPVSVISMALIFVISFALLKKTRLPLCLILAIGILIAIFLV